LIPFVYYISGHGYGHVVRSRQVISSLKKRCPELECYVRTSAPKWFFEELLFLLSYSNRLLDVGVLQKNALEMDLEGTLRACQELHKELPQLIKEEMTFIRAREIRLVIGDVPPLCFEIAARSSLPSVAIANFTWDWVYRSYLSGLPSFLPLIQEMEEFYRKATLALSLPFSCDLEIFPHQIPIPLIARVSSLDKQEARKRFDLPATAQIVLISFGGFGLEQLGWERLGQNRDFFFVTTGSVLKREKNFLVLPEVQSHYEELVCAADAVVSKPGYGIMADVIAHRVPILYTSRGPFPEYPFLVEALTQWATSEFIPQENLLKGEIGSYLHLLLGKNPNWPSVPLNGAQVAAEKILDLLK